MYFGVVKNQFSEAYLSHPSDFFRPILFALSIWFLVEKVGFHICPVIHVLALALAMGLPALKYPSNRLSLNGHFQAPKTG